MPFEIKKNELLKKYNKIWNKVSNIIEKTLNTQPVFEETYLKNKPKYYNGKSNRQFFDKKVLKENVNCVCIAVIVLDSVYQIKKNTFTDIYSLNSSNTKRKKKKQPAPCPKTSKFFF